MTTIREAMPLLARHEGEWVGSYIYVDPAGKIVDQHASHLTCSFPLDGTGDYFQINHYTWDDGKQEEHRFPGMFRDGRIWFDSERIKGHAWEADDKTVILTWHYKTDPANYLYEMIQLSPCGQHRARTWHWFENGELVRRTLIKETRLK
jgi:hypothetical protein